MANGYSLSGNMQREQRNTKHNPRNVCGLGIQRRSGRPRAPRGLLRLPGQCFPDMELIALARHPSDVHFPFCFFSVPAESVFFSARTLSRNLRRARRRRLSRALSPLFNDMVKYLYKNLIALLRSLWWFDAFAASTDQPMWQQHRSVEILPGCRPTATPSRENRARWGPRHWGSSCFFAYPALRAGLNSTAPLPLVYRLAIVVAYRMNNSDKLAP